MGEGQLQYNTRFIPKAKLFEGHSHTPFSSDKNWSGKETADPRSSILSSSLLSSPTEPGTSKVGQEGLTGIHVIPLS